MIGLVLLSCFIITFVDIVGFDVMADFLFDMIFWTLLSKSHHHTVSEDKNGNSSGTASVGSSTAKAVDAALNSNHRFHHVLAVLRKERTILKGISAQDQFARWAKQKRLVDALEEKANSLCNI